MIPSLGASTASTWTDRFELGEELGRGSLGTVFRTFDRDLGAHIALKVLSRNDDAWFAHLSHEFRMGAARLRRADSPEFRSLDEAQVAAACG